MRVSCSHCIVLPSGPTCPFSSLCSADKERHYSDESDGERRGKKRKAVVAVGGSGGGGVVGANVKRRR